MIEDEQLELKVRRILASEVEQHRNFLQTQFKYLTWTIGVLLTAGAIIFSYLFGKSIDESKEQLVSTIDSKVVDYRIVESFKDRLEEFIGIAVNNAVDAESTKQKVDELVNQKATKYVLEAEEGIDRKITALVEDVVAKVEKFDTKDLIKKVSLPTGSVLAFKRSNCPTGWSDFDEGAGRVILGVGKGQGLTERKLLDRGGGEKHILTIQEMPKHHHVLNNHRNDRRDDRGFGGSENNIHQAAGFQVGVSSAGENQPHNNMQPFIALRLCQKD